MMLEIIMNTAIATMLLSPVRWRLRAIFSDIPRRYLACSLTLLVLLIVAQSTASSSGAYPLSEWNMHTVAVKADPEFIDYTILRSDGREDRLLVGRLFPIVGKKLRSRMDRFARAAESAGSVNHRDAAEGLDEMLARSSDAYAADHPGVTVRSVRVWL